MTTWHAVAVIATAPLNDDALAAATEALPGFATITQHAVLGRIEARFESPGETVLEAATAAHAAVLDAIGTEPSALTIADEPPAAGIRRQLAGQLVGASDCAKILGVSRQRFRELAGKPPAGFPAPIGAVGSSEIYLRPEIELFAVTWTRERTGRTAAGAIRAAERLHDAACAALTRAGFTLGKDAAVSWGADHTVLVSLIPPHLGRTAAQRAAAALADVRIALTAHARRQDGREPEQLLADGELLALTAAPSDRAQR